MSGVNDGPVDPNMCLVLHAFIIPSSYVQSNDNRFVLIYIYII